MFPGIAGGHSETIGEFPVRVLGQVQVLLDKAQEIARVIFFEPE